MTRPRLEIEWESAGDFEQDETLAFEIADFAMTCLKGFDPVVSGVLRPDAGQEKDDA